VVKDNRESCDSSQGVKLMKSPISLAIWICLLGVGHADQV
jgi:hypothetical protein